MEFNQLPEDFEGSQKRKTEFESVQAKLSHEAEHLVAKAREALKETGVENASNNQVMAAIELIVGSHRKDLNIAVEGTDQTLKKAVESNLYTEEEQAQLAQAKYREGLRAEYETFIDGANLSEPDSLNLKEMMSEVNYLLAVDTAKELKASKIPTFEQIVTELMTYTPEKLKDICAMMEKPELVIESDQGFADNVAAMNENKHYTTADGKPQEDTYVNSESQSPYRNLNKPGKVKASIVDGVVHPKAPVGISTRLGERGSYYTAKYAAKGMRHISPNGSAALLQQSMKRAKASGDNSLIVDNWEKWEKENIPGTATLLNPIELTDSALVACSVFSSDLRRAKFRAYDPSSVLGRARGRASVQVLEI